MTWILIVAFLAPYERSVSATVFHSEHACIESRDRARRELGENMVQHTIVECVEGGRGEGQKP